MATLVTPSAPAPASDILGTYKRAPQTFVRGDGVRLYDDTGAAYLDFTAGIAVNALGYNDAGFARAVQEALATGLVHTSNLFRTAPGERLASRLVALSFADKAFFCNSGAEAVEGAFKFARKWARSVGGAAKHELFALRGSFHGRTMGALAATDRPQYRAPFRPLAAGISILERDLGEFARALDPESAAAVIVEPVQGESGIRILDAGFLRELRALCTERSVLLILDEIQCGLGRTGTLFAYEQAGVTPDLLVLAKPIANGLPMGAVLLTDRVAAAMAPGDHGTTFGGGPLVAHVAGYVLDRLSDPALLAHVRAVGAAMGRALGDLAERHGKVRAVRGVGMMWGVDVTDPAAQVIARARDLGLLLVASGEHTLRLLPPLVMSETDALAGLGMIEQALG
jgi:predicted acetylornithine/succinylornithine family transaminase